MARGIRAQQLADGSAADFAADTVWAGEGREDPRAVTAGRRGPNAKSVTVATALRWTDRAPWHT